MVLPRPQRGEQRPSVSVRLSLAIESMFGVGHARDLAALERADVLVADVVAQPLGRTLSTLDVVGSSPVSLSKPRKRAPHQASL